MAARGGAGVAAPAAERDCLSRAGPGNGRTRCPSERESCSRCFWSAWVGNFGEVFVTHWRAPRAAAAEGESSPVFLARDDIMALGQILYEMTHLHRHAEADATGRMPAPTERARQSAPGRATRE